VQAKFTARREGRLEHTHDAASPGARTGGGSTVRVWPRRWGALQHNPSHNSTNITRSHRLEGRLTGWRGAADCAGRHELASRTEPADARPQRFTSVELTPGAGVCMVSAHALPFPAQGRHGTEAVHRAQDTTRALRLARRASRGDARLDGKRLARRPAVRSTRRCGLGWPRCWVRTSTTCRDVRPWGNGVAAHMVHDGSKAHPQA
jgi:hypothetical protein